MPQKRPPDNTLVRRPGLVLYWYETKADEQPKIWWAQLASAMRRLIAVQQEFLTLGRRQNVDTQLRRLELCIESYILRAFEARERALGLLASRTNRKNEVKKLRHASQRSEALLTLKRVEPILTPAVENLLSLLDEDVELRNLHTHSLYLNLGLDAGDDIFDPFDALVDVSNDLAAHAKLMALLRSESQKMASRYVSKTDQLQTAIESILKIADHDEKSAAGAPRSHR